MGITTADRAAIRVAYNYRCGYCGVSEISVGGELEIDHFQPSVHDGSDDLDNLVYACTICNRFKGDYWPLDEAPDNFRLLHPLHNDVSEHITLAANGRLVGKTTRGWFHIRWLHLNRPQLIVWRQLQQQNQMLLEAVENAHLTKTQLQAQIRELEREVS